VDSAQSLHAFVGQLNHLANKSVEAKNPILAIKLSLTASLSGFSSLQVQHLNMIVELSLAGLQHKIVGGRVLLLKATDSPLDV